jgi:hypothetical protein
MIKKNLLTGILLLLVLAGCFLLADYLSSTTGTGGNAPAVNGSGHATPTANVTKNPTAATHTPTTAAAKSTPATTKTTSVPTPTPTPQAYSTSQIDQHLIDIAFDPNHPTISKIDASSAKIAITGAYVDKDVTLLSSFDQQFNTRSTTLMLPNAPVQTTQGDIIINFLPGSSLASLSADTTYNTVNTKQILNTDGTGTLCSIYRTIATPITNQRSISPTTYIIYLNSDLAGDKRGHYLIRGVLYFLGFPGETARYPDSIFYSQPNTVANLSTIDWGAVQVMYGNKISNGMTLSTIRGILPT